jgi:hypothetical protein
MTFSFKLNKQYIYLNYLTKPFVMVHSITTFEIILQW